MNALRHLPNLISLLRVALVGPALWFLLQLRYAEALATVFVAGASDALDGYLAKRYAWHSRIGAVLDPLADKILLIASYIALAYLQLVPLWLAVLILARDLIIVTGATAYYFLIVRIDMTPSISSKINTVAQIALVLLVIVAQLLPWLAPDVIAYAIWAVAATSVWSGVSYVAVWSRHALRAAARHE
ncbi:MAG: CDP-alcohol phosphatidyltransferase family protein [Pseudomonadota bacterium]